MSFLDLAMQRYSMRKFSDKKVPEDIIDKIIYAGYIAPTACNNQPQRVLIINTPEAIEKMKKCTKYDFGSNTALLVCYNKSECWHRPFDGETAGPVDASIITTHMMLQAEELGIGSTWVMCFDPDVARKEFEIPSDIIPVALLVMGYPAEDARPAHLHTEYRPLEEVVVRNKF